MLCRVQIENQTLPCRFRPVRICAQKKTITFSIVNDSLLARLRNPHPRAVIGLCIKFGHISAR